MSNRLHAGLGLLLPAALILNGCVQTEIVGRYDRASCATGSFNDKGTPVIGEDNDCTTIIPRIKYSTTMLTPAESVQLTGATAAAPAGPSKPKTGFDMPERAMKSYLELLAQAKDKEAASTLRTYFAAPIGASSPDTAPKDLTGLTGTLNLTLMQAGDFNPGDRIERAMIEIRPLNTRIRNWTAARTAFDQIVEGTLASSQTESAELTASPAAALGLPFTGSGKVTAGASQTQNLTVSRRVEDTTPVVDYDTNTLTVVREGGAFRSLTGNTQVGMTLGLEGPDGTEAKTALRNFYAVKAFKNGKNWIAPDEFDVTRQSVLVAIVEGDLIARVKMTYVIRHVLSGGGTSPERDDNVRFITITEPTKELALVPEGRIGTFQPGLTAPNYSIVVASKDKTPLSIRGSETPERGEILCFSDYQNALQMVDYLKKAPGDLRIFGKYEIGLVLPPPPETFIPFDKSTMTGLSVGTNCYPRNTNRPPKIKLQILRGLEKVPQL